MNLQIRRVSLYRGHLVKQIPGNREKKRFNAPIAPPEHVIVKLGIPEPIPYQGCGKKDCYCCGEKNRIIHLGNAYIPSAPEIALGTLK